MYHTVFKCSQETLPPCVCQELDLSVCVTQPVSRVAWVDDPLHGFTTLQPQETHLNHIGPWVIELPVARGDGVVVCEQLFFIPLLMTVWETPVQIENSQLMHFLLNWSNYELACSENSWQRRESMTGWGRACIKEESERVIENDIMKEITVNLKSLFLLAEPLERAVCLWIL